MTKEAAAGSLCRLDLNDPPTAVGGIRRRSGIRARHSYDRPFLIRPGQPRNLKPFRLRRHSPETTTKIFVDTTKLFVVGLRPDKFGRIDGYAKEGSAPAD